MNKESNRLIAEFLGWVIESGMEQFENPYYRYNNGWSMAQLSDMPFATSWDWLMSVVEKIESMGYYVLIEQNLVTVYDKQEVYHWYGGRTSESKIISTYVAIVEFIKWYNQQKEK
jgi:hypothetical protein